MSTVVVDKITDSTIGLYDQFMRTFDFLGISSPFNQARSVFIKPNLTYPRFKEGVTTRKVFVERLVSALRSINQTTKIYIGEGEGGYHSFSMSEAMRDMGFYEIAHAYPNVEIVNLSFMPVRQVELNAKGQPYPLNLPEIFFEEIDFSITCPVPKVHCMTGISLSYKNQWGCLPDLMRLKNHYVFNEIISQVCDVLKFRYSFLDGKYGLDNNGPMKGDPVELNWFAASNSLGALDCVVADMMGFNWRKIGHIKKAYKRGFVPDKNDINIIGNPNSFKRKFRLKRSFWNYPALAAFHSKQLTHFVYISRWAKFIHDIMYLVRKRAVSD